MTQETKIQELEFNNKLLFAALRYTTSTTKILLQECKTAGLEVFAADAVAATELMLAKVAQAIENLGEQSYD